jgi:hypothetical protein
MPNTVVKLIYAESTWPEAAREDRKLLIKRISRESVRFFYSAYSKIIPLRGMAPAAPHIFLALRRAT